MGEDLLPLLKDVDVQGELKPEFTILVGDKGVSKRRESTNFLNGCDDVCMTISISDAVVDGDRGRMQKAMELFSIVPSFGKQTSIDPFLNMTPRVSGLYENAKTILLLPLLILRLAVVALILVVGFFATKFALAGWKKSQVVLPKWRRKLMGVTRLCGRGILYCFGWVISGNNQNENKNLMARRTSHTRSVV